MISFNHAFTISGDPKFLLWEAYAIYLLSEFRSDVDEKTQRKLLHILIKILERLQYIALKHKNREIREQALYYLGCSYSRYKDYVTAIGKLEKCLQENTNSEVSQAARSLLERNLIRERTNAGLTAARARGRKGGRPKALTLKKTQQLHTLYADKTNTIDEICRTLNISRATLYRYIKPHSS